MIYLFKLKYFKIQIKEKINFLSKIKIKTVISVVTFHFLSKSIVTFQKSRKKTLKTKF